MMQLNFNRYVLTVHKTVLQHEVEILKLRIRDHATGHIHTSLSVLDGRIKEIDQELDSIDVALKQQSVAPKQQVDILA
jgi:hypothetical protein